MKLEKLSENSIRCTIDRKEFETYKIKLGEIIVGKRYLSAALKANEEVRSGLIVLVATGGMSLRHAQYETGGQHQ